VRKPQPNGLGPTRRYGGEAGGRPVGFTAQVGIGRAVERVVGIGAAATASRRVRIAAQLVLVGGLIFVALRLRSIWHDSRLDLDRVDWPLLVAAAALTAGATTATGFVWLAILRRLRVDVRPWHVGVFLQAQLGKYIPGSVWQYAGRATLARAYGLPWRAVAVSLPIELVASALAGAAGSLLLLGGWGAASALLLLLALSSVGAPPLEPRARLLLRRAVRGRNVEGAVAAAARAVGPYAAILAVYGFGFWLTAKALFDVPAADVPRYVGAFVAAWLAGLVAIYAPGGIGVREAVLVAVLRGKLGSSDALVVAAASRALLTFVDVVAAAIGFALTRRVRRRDAAPTGTLAEPKVRSPP
jgi:glycosyltransferase 2 family protein